MYVHTYNRMRYKQIAIKSQVWETKRYTFGRLKNALEKPKLRHKKKIDRSLDKMYLYLCITGYASSRIIYICTYIYTTLGYEFIKSNQIMLIC